MNPTVTLRSLQWFLVVAEELHFGRAATRLHVTQPPLTRTIQTLEAEIGAQLFDRTTRDVRLTPAGEVLFVEARRLISDVKTMRNRVLEAADGRGRTVHIGVVESASLTRMPSVISEFRRRFKQIHLHIHELHSADQLQMISDRVLDWGLLRGPVSDIGLSTTLAYNDPLVAVVSANSFDDVKSIELSSLIDTSIILYDQSLLGPGFLSAVVTACAQAGFTPRISETASSTAMLLSLVSEGTRVGVVSEAVATISTSDVKFIPIVNPTPISPVLLAWRSGERTPELEALIDILRDSRLQSNH